MRAVRGLDTLAHVGVVRSSARLVAGLALVAVYWACDGGGRGRLAPPEPPADLEPLLAERIDGATRAVREDPDSAAAWGWLGEIYDVNSFEQQALITYARARELDPEEWRWPYFTGLLLRSSDPDGALEQFSRAATLKTDYPALEYHLGMGHYLAEEVDRAEHRFRRAIELDPNLINARLGLARVAMTRGEPAAALALLEASDQDEGAVHVHLAQIYHELGRGEEAEREEALTASSARPALPDAMTALDDPVRDEVKRREGVNSERLLREARQLLLESKDEEAIRIIEKAIEADPESVTALVVYARLLAKYGDLQGAGMRLEQAAEIEPENVDVIVQLSTVYALAGRRDLATDGLKKAIALAPERADVKVNLAGLLVQEQQLRKALPLLRAADGEQPNDPTIQSRLASVLDALGLYDEAVPIWQRLVDEDAERTGAIVSLGRSLWKLQRFDEAVEAFSLGAESAPDDLAVNRWLAWALATCPKDSLRNGELAASISRELCEASSYRNFDHLDVYAAALAETGKFDAAAHNARAGVQILQGILDAEKNDTRRFSLERMVEGLRSRLALYEIGRPYRDGG